MSSPKTLTIVVLTYNSAKTIADCLDSLTTQKYTSFSVLIVDDSSTDKTLSIVEKYAGVLDISVTTNGTNNIAHGRNIGLNQGNADIIAFVDSDDTAEPNWTETIVTTFTNEPTLALISGSLLPSFRTTFARAVAMNDDVMRNLFGGGILQFCTCNSAINRRLVPDIYFHEAFVNAEDLEFAARIEKNHSWRHIPDMAVKHETRDTAKRYIKQIYHYGKWKLFFSYRMKQFRAIDYVPLAAGLSFIAGALITPYSLLGLLGLPLAQAFVTILKARPTVALVPYIVLAWSIKNISWSVGTVVGFVQLATQGGTRKVLKSQQTEAAT